MHIHVHNLCIRFALIALQSSTASIHNMAFESVKSELQKYYNSYNKTIKSTQYVTDYIQRYVHCTINAHVHV